MNTDVPPRPETVRDATITVLRELGLTTMFANPGSTEVPFLADLPDDIEFVLALHEGSVVGIATGHALATDRPALVLLHTTAGLGNAVGAIATARVNRAPVVVLVGQQDRRHLALEPFLAGRLKGLAGDYPLEVIEPATAADAPSAIARATHLASVGRGPVLVIVPMDDWDQPAVTDRRAAPTRLAVAGRGVPQEADEVAAMVAAAGRTALVAGAAVDTDQGWAAVRDMARRSGADVWAEPFGARAGFDQTDDAYAGQLPADRPRLRAALAAYDLVLVVGTAALRQYPFEEGPLAPDGTTLVVLTSDAAEAARSPAALSLVGDEVAMLRAVGAALSTAPGAGHGGPSRLERSGSGPGVAPPEPGDGAGATRAGDVPLSVTRADGAQTDGLLTPEDVFDVLAEHLPHDTVLVEETPSSRPALQAMVPARRPLGFLSAAMGGLGFALPAAIGVRMARPSRPVIAVIGDGSSLYGIQALWTAVHHSVGVLVIVLANGRYAVMDRLADRRGGKPAWPAFPEVSVSTIAAGFGVATVRITERTALQAVLPDLCARLADRAEPLLVEIGVAPGDTFQP